MFGWNLQGRQEIHEEGNAETSGRPSYVSNNTYVVKTTTTVKHYVKLHFTRSLSLPNLDKIKHVEAEYFGLQFPAPPSLVGPFVTMGFFGLCALTTFPTIAQDPGGGFGALVIFGGLVALGYWWLTKRQKARSEARETCAASAKRIKELRADIGVLMG